MPKIIKTKMNYFVELMDDAIVDVREIVALKRWTWEDRTPSITIYLRHDRGFSVDDPTGSEYQKLCNAIAQYHSAESDDDAVATTESDDSKTD